MSSSDDYQARALATESIPPSIRLVHAHLGLSSELAEIEACLADFDDFDKVNFAEELGDMLWYVAVAADALERSMPVPDRVPEHISLRDTKRDLVVAVGMFADDLKKHVFYGSPLREATMANQLQSVVDQINGLIELHASQLEEAGAPASFEEVMRANIAKLAKRYGGEFSSENALDRDLDEERRVLEGKTL